MKEADRLRTFQVDDHNNLPSVRSVDCPLNVKVGRLLVNAFKNREIKFGFSLQNINTVFDALAIKPVYF